LACELADSSSPPLSQRATVSMLASSSLSPLGGMNGSAACVITL
jgi:hypothetical protein